MTERYQSTFACCPFYNSETRNLIYCEGVAEKTLIHLAFESPTDRKAYEVAHCCGRYGDCMIERMLEKKYDNKN